MYKKTITYEDYNGVERTEDFWFNLTKAELMKMEMSTQSGMSDLLQKMMRESDNKRLTELFEELILNAYGEKSLDGKRFVKSKELSEAFSQTEAYSELFFELATNADSAIAFIKGIIPSSLSAELDKVDKEELLSGNLLTTK